MAVLVSLMVIAASSPLVALLLRAAWVTLSCYWLTPMRIRRAMAAQGVRGPPPRPLVGNLREVSALVARATADDMPSLSHDIVGRLMPHYVLWSGTYGKLFVYLYGSEPRLCLTDTALIKEFLSSKYAHATGKSWLQRQGTKHFIGGGLLMANGARWAHQRHVVAPAFMADKLKARSRAHGGVHEAGDPRAPRRGGGAARRGGGDRRPHDPPHRRHHLPHRVQHQLRHWQAHLPPPRAPPAPHLPLQPPSLDPRQPVFPEQVQEGDQAAQRRAGGGADGVDTAEQGDRRRGEGGGGDVREGFAGYASVGDGGEGEEWRRRRRRVQLRRAAGDRRVQDLLLRRPRDVGAAAHVGDHAARHQPGVAGEGPHRGRRRLRRPPAVRRPPLQAHRAADDHPGDAAAVPAGDAAAADGVRGHPARRPPAAAGAVGVDPGAGHPPRRVHLGPRRARVPPGEVRAGRAPPVGRRRRQVPAVRRRPAQLRRPGVRARRGQGRPRHAPLGLPLRHLRQLPPRAGERAHPPPQARRPRPPPAAAAIDSILFFSFVRFGAIARGRRRRGARVADSGAHLSVARLVIWCV
ncbi:Os09g0403300 [Oryza sativa Japonica Group]|uniref:Os09g0403300 protein n=1 Tax=Oryza sativa subsp. japonica TaxID=39947 RepID=A0A0P0XMQ9_ORYSJ|nr:Os09g0403300 [Oryza sativa Japonica Group]